MSPYGSPFVTHRAREGLKSVRVKATVGGAGWLVLACLSVADCTLAFPLGGLDAHRAPGGSDAAVGNESGVAVLPDVTAEHEFAADDATGQAEEQLNVDSEAEEQPELLPNAKRWVLRIGIPLGVLGIAAMASGATPLHSWNTGDKLEATDLNGNFANLQNQIGVLQATPLAASMFRFSTTCAQSPNVATAFDCTCMIGEIAVSGGGYCGPTTAIVESGNAILAGQVRSMSSWRFNCATGTPSNAYALCVNAP
jgi:hypothetical protein